MKKIETTNTPETISSTIFGSAAILQTLGVNMNSSGPYVITT
jgi:hypothetical protein